MPRANRSSRVPKLRWLRRAPKGIAAKYARGSPPRLGVLSGAFNPPTRAHLALAETARTMLALDEVLFVLPEVQPHKKRLEASLDARAEMLLLAIARNPRFSGALSSHGLFLDIHRAVVPHYPAGTRMYFLTGRDAAERILLRWPYRDPEKALREMFARFELGVAGRGGRFEIPADSPAARYAQKIHPLETPAGTGEISATRARERAAHGHPLETLVPKEVAGYIVAHHLYRPQKA